MQNQEPEVGTIVKDKDGVPWLRGGDGPVWRSDGRYRDWSTLVDEFGPVEVIYTPTEPRVVTVHFSGGPWNGQTIEVERVISPVFLPGNEVGNHYWLDIKSDPPTYFWNPEG